MKKTQPTPEKRLCMRIQREFERRKLLGDIPINDDEYMLLIGYLKRKLLWLKNLKLRDVNDRILCVALVQIGIRCYDSAFWPHVRKELNMERFTTQDQELLGRSFFRTMNARGKLVLNESDRVSAILMQAFVCDNYAPKFFDFLYAFYNIDLERDLSRLDRNAMHELIEVMQRTDNTGRTYQLVGQTANAIRLHPRGAKTRIRRYLRLIDRAFWNEPLPEGTQNRLTRRFLEWAKSSEDIQSAQQEQRHGGRRKKQYSSPYYKIHVSTGQVKLMLPPQHLRFADFIDLTWDIHVGIRELQIPINPYAQGVTGFRTEEASLVLNGDEVLKGCNIRLMNGDEVLRSFSLKENKYHLFNASGESVSSEHLQAGITYSLSPASCIPVSDALQMEKSCGELCYCSFLLEDGDLICFPDMPPIAVGNRVSNGLMPRGCVPGVRFVEEDSFCPVYASAPTLILTLPSHRVTGTAIILNGVKYPVVHDGIMIDGATVFPIQDGTDSVGIMLPASALGCFENGKYTLSVDMPGRSGCTNYHFLLLKKFRFRFADAPYLFKTHGTLCLPPAYPLEHMYANSANGVLEYEIELTPDLGVQRYNCGGFSLEFDIPVFRYRFAGEQWMIAAHIDVWHSAFQPMLEVQCPGSQITFSLDEYGNDSDDKEEHEDTFYCSSSDRIFHCDLTRFASWFGRQSAKRTIYIQCGDMEQKQKFLGVVTKSILLSGSLQANEEERHLIGSFQIIGKAEYYADLWCGAKCLAEKIPLTEGQFIVKTELHSGIYTAKIYEAEEDEYGFGSIYYEIGSREMQIIDPNDLSGKSVQILQIQPVNEHDSYLILYYKYLITNLQKTETDQDSYIGKMIVKTKGGTLKATFPVCLTIPDILDLNAGYVEFDDDGEPAPFLYDSVERSLVKFADHRKGKSVIYRRYAPVLWTDEYLCRLSFVIPTEQELQCEMDDTEYNNLKYH